MFTKIVVPLDGSALSELALEPAFALAEKFEAELVLLRITLPEEVRVGVPPMMPYGTGALPGPIQPTMEEAEAYLNRIQLNWMASPVRVQPQVFSGPPPEIIISVAREQKADLIVMSTHGRTGITRLIYGSVAEAVLRGSTVPVMLIPRKMKRYQSN
jgi:nucleotide-binding universal stress UspA family protein